MANHRAIVGGWDTSARRPKGVASAADVRASLQMTATHQGIMQEVKSGQLHKSTVSMRLTWWPFTAVIRSRLGGWYTPRIDSGSVELDPGHFSYPRIDIIWVKQHDYQLDGAHPESEIEIGVAKGTPTASPAEPAIPTGALKLWTVVVPAKASNANAIKDITPAPQVCPAGGLLILGSQDREDQLTAALKEEAVVNQYRPLIAYRADIQEFQIFNGRTWEPAVYPDSIEINGRRYPRSGTIPVDAVTWIERWSPTFVTSLTVNAPYAPPPGYTFTFACHESSGFTFVSRASTRSERNYVLRLLQVGSSSTTALAKISWQLIRES